MDETVSHENGAPVFYKGDVSFSSLVVERLTVQGFADDKHYTVYYAGTGTKTYNQIVLLYKSMIRKLIRFFPDFF